jgi:hypothetical protein
MENNYLADCIATMKHRCDAPFRVLNIYHQ